MLSGVGGFCLRSLTYDLTDNFIFPGSFVNFSLTVNTTSKEALAWSGGRKVTKSSAIASEETTLTLTSQYADWATLAWAFDEIPDLSQNELVPITKAANADDSGNISDSDIPGGTRVYCFVNTTGSWGLAQAIPDSEVSSSAGSISLGAKYKNAPITYHYEKPVSSILTIGVNPEAQQYGKLTFSGIAYGPEFAEGVIVVVPEITRKSSPSLTSDDVPEFTVEYSANVPTGFKKAFRLYNMETLA